MTEPAFNLSGKAALPMPTAVEVITHLVWIIRVGQLADRPLDLHDDCRLCDRAEITWFDVSDGRRIAARPSRPSQDTPRCEVVR